MFAFLAVSSTYLILYTILVHNVADRWAFEYDGRGYSAMYVMLFPWPSGPSKDIALPDIAVKMNAVDEFIYLYLVKTKMLILACLLIWMLTAICFCKAILPSIKARKPSNDQTRAGG